MYAIVETGGKQFRVASGDRLRVPSIPGEIGSEVTLAACLRCSPEKKAKTSSENEPPALT